MKTFLFLSLISLGVLTNFANASVEERLAALEARVQELEMNLPLKLESCSLEFKYYDYYLTQCPKNTVVNQVNMVGNDVAQLRCAYYQLRCQKKGPKGAFEEVIVDVELKN